MLWSLVSERSVNETNIEVLLVGYYEVFLIQRFKCGFSAERDDCPDVVNGLSSNLCWEIVEHWATDKVVLIKIRWSIYLFLYRSIHTYINILYCKSDSVSFLIPQSKTVASQSSHWMENSHLSSCFKLLLFFSSMLSKCPHLCYGWNCEKGHHGEANQCELPAEYKGSDDTGAYVAEALQ